MRCVKQRCFPTSRLAREQMLKVPARADGVFPCHVYYCGTHKAWHFSSKPSGRRRRRG